ncbi:hypothetical protein HPB50_005776 [Hyalomma asiaticum]|uniref:Uncharacterized protein n=1 Tax=Hyalomma asiaticum TaxID=266040 RepID=A0ACB7T1E5_HYAAI|nr:hypothetical protein HPB50_005776 [Hyalomma asiaticum]
MENASASRHVRADGNGFRNRCILQPLQIGSRRSKRRGLPPLREPSPPWRFDPITGDVIKPGRIECPRSHTEHSTHKLATCPAAERKVPVPRTPLTVSEVCTGDPSGDAGEHGGRLPPSNACPDGAFAFHTQPNSSFPLLRVHVSAEETGPRKKERPGRGYDGIHLAPPEPAVAGMPCLRPPVPSVSNVLTPGAATEDHTQGGRRIARGRGRGRLLSPAQPGVGMPSRSQGTSSSPVPRPLASAPNFGSGRDDITVSARQAVRCSSPDRTVGAMIYVPPLPSSVPVLRTPGAATEGGVRGGKQIPRGRGRGRLMAPTQPGATMAPRSEGPCSSPISRTLASTRKFVQGRDDISVRQRDGVRCSSPQRREDGMALSAPRVSGLPLLRAALAAMEVSGRDGNTVARGRGRGRRLSHVVPGGGLPSCS